MDLIFIVLSLVPGLFGLFLCVDFCLWRFASETIEGEVVGFQKTKSKGRVLPIIRVQREAGKFVDLNVRRIDDIAYLFDPGQKGEIKEIAVKGAQAILPGYAHLIPGVLMLGPFLIALGLFLDNTMLLNRVAYLFIFGVLMVGAWVFLKLIQRV